MTGPTGLRTEGLVKEHDRTSFSCGVSELDSYLRLRAGQETRKHVASTYVLVAAESPKVLGYYTLSAAFVSFEDIPDQIGKKRCPGIPHFLPQ